LLREAIAYCEAAVAARRDSVTLASLAYAEAVGGRLDLATRTLAEVGAISRSALVSPYYHAIAQVGVGDCGEALRLLRVACDVRDPAVIQLGVDPRFDGIREKREYADLAGRLRLADGRN